MTAGIQSVREQASLAQNAFASLRKAPTAQKNAAILEIASELLRQRGEVENANSSDCKAAQAQGKEAAFLDRLELSRSRIDKLAESLKAIADLPDPVGEILEDFRRPDGLHVSRVRVPLGVIALIFEARPGVSIETAVLTLKSGNASLLRPGREAFQTAQVFSRIVSTGLRSAGLPSESSQLLQDLRHDAIRELVQLEGLVDLVIPRGGEGLIRTVVEHARVPVLKHYKGVCHIYVHPSADSEMLRRVVVNAKCQRPGVCNALETLLVDKRAMSLLPGLLQELFDHGVEIRGDETVRTVFPQAIAATEEDWSAEYLDLILSVRVVDSMEHALQHIARYSSRHTDAILAEEKEAQHAFLESVDSATVLVNASTRLCDGGEFGLGAEIGISTDKLHARGPMGIRELTTYQWRVLGAGHIRQ